MTIKPKVQVLGILLLQTLLLAISGDARAAEVLVDREVKRLDPVIGDLVVVQSPLPGKIYNHYSDRLNQRVWAFAKSDGSFSHAMGEGSTQNTNHFDFPYSTEQQQEIIARVAPRWAKSMQHVGSEAYVRLNNEGTWKLVQHLAVESLYDLETARRWEWHGKRRVAVSHTGGYRWRVVDGRYLSESGYSYGGMPTSYDCNSCRRAGSAY